MLRNYLNKFSSEKIGYIFVVVSGLIASFYFSTNLLSTTIWLMEQNGIPLKGINENVLASIVAVMAYGMTLYIFYRILEYVSPYLTKKEIGIDRSLKWSDIFITPVAFLAYFVLSTALLIAATYFLPNLVLEQAQNIGFNNVSRGYELFLAFFTLIVLAPVAEELLFRGYLLGSLRRRISAWPAILIVSVAFGFAHGSVNVGIDTFSLSLVMSILRVKTGSLWPSILLHALKNSLAFYLLFINPTFLTTIGG